MQTRSHILLFQIQDAINMVMHDRKDQTPENDILFLLYINITHPSRLILRVRSSQRFLVSAKMMVLFSFSAMISSISWINLSKGSKKKTGYDH